jgi:hypothetical protein
MVSSELEGIAAKESAADRLTALVEYIERGEARLREARALRDAAIRELRAAGQTRPQVAAAAKVSIAHVAAVTAQPKT